MRQQKTESVIGIADPSMSIALPILVVLRPFLHCDFRIALHAMVLLVGLLFVMDFKLKKPGNPNTFISRSSSGCSSLDIETKIHVRGEIMIYADRNGNRTELFPIRLMVLESLTVDNFYSR